MLLNPDGTEALMYVDGREVPIYDGDAYEYDYPTETAEEVSLRDTVEQLQRNLERTARFAVEVDERVTETKAETRQAATVAQEAETKARRAAETTEEVQTEVQDVKRTIDETSGVAERIADRLDELAELFRYGEAFVKKVGDFAPPKRP